MSIDEFIKRFELSGNFKQKESVNPSSQNIQKIVIEFGLNKLEISLTQRTDSYTPGTGTILLKEGTVLVKS